MKIGVIGGGAIGLLTAALLDLNKHQVTVYTRKKQQTKYLKEKNLLLLPNEQIVKVRAAHIEELQNEELFIVCVKQYQLADLIPKLKQVSGAFLFLQNGIGHVELVEKMETTSPVFLGVVEHGAIRSTSYIVNQTGEGIIRIAAFNYQASQALEIIESLINERFPVSMEADWYMMVINKLVVNTVINPLTALFDVKNGALLTNHFLNTLAKQLTREISDALNLDAEEQWKRVSLIIDNTASNMSSMRADINQNRPTEIEGMVGYLLRTSKKDLPGILFIYQAVKALEIKGKQERD